MPIHRVSRTYLLGLPWLPGLSPDEGQLVLEFVRFSWPHEDRFSVNLPVGAGDDAAPSLGAAIDRMWSRITRRKIDLVIWRHQYAFVLEAKVHARMSAATQVLRYARLLRDDYHHLHTVAPVILARSCELGLHRVLEPHGGEVLVLPARGVVTGARA